MRITVVCLAVHTTILIDEKSVLITKDPVGIIQRPSYRVINEWHWNPDLKNCKFVFKK
jgi:hypothetical protein